MKEFWFHYNRPLSVETGITTVSVYVGDKQFNGTSLVCNVKTESKIREEQPVFIMTGKCKIIVTDGNNIEIF